MTQALQTRTDLLNRRTEQRLAKGCVGVTTFSRIFKCCGQSRSTAGSKKINGVMTCRHCQEAKA